MAFKIQAFILILTLSISISYSIEFAPAGSPTELGRRALEGSSDKEAAVKENMVKNLKEVLPKYKEFLRSLKERIGMIINLDTPAKACVVESCINTFETEYSDLQKLVEVMSSGADEEFQPTVDARELEGCKSCLAQLAKEDPKIAEAAKNLEAELETAEKEEKTYNS